MPERIAIRGASQTNLKQLSLDLPLHELIVCWSPIGRAMSK